VQELVLTLPDELNEHGEQMLWHGSWLVSADGVEGDAFYSGRGGMTGRYALPAAAVGLRVRRWPNEGLEPEYADVLELAHLRELHGSDLDFDVTQPFSRLPSIDRTAAGTFREGQET
jgi:hypothetical protein